MPAIFIRFFRGYRIAIYTMPFGTNTYILYRSRWRIAKIRIENTTTGHIRFHGGVSPSIGYIACLIGIIVRICCLGIGIVIVPILNSILIHQRVVSNDRVDFRYLQNRLIVRSI